MEVGSRQRRSQLPDHIELVSLSQSQRHRGNNNNTSSHQSHDPSSEEEEELYEHHELLPEPLYYKGTGGPSEKSTTTRVPQGQQISLRKDITLLSGVAVVTGQIIGSGIYVAPKLILTYAGSFGVCIILWLFGAVVAICGGLCYVELGLLLRKSGGEFLYLVKAYSFKHRNKATTVLGSVLGFMSLWGDFCVVRPSGLAVAVLLCARYFIRPFFIGCCIPELAIKCLAISVLSKYYCKPEEVGHDRKN